ncbi:MAG: Hsp70 family protein, partial [Gammaproteobacteria bacterium]|nr:Hsp70 family protein [Gammaproteobacteria bacterium]
IHATRKTLEEAGDKATDDEKQAIETAISELEEAVKGDDVDNIQKKLDALTEASGQLAQKMYAEQAEAAQQEGGEGAESTSKPEEDVVDAEYEEVNDDQKKQ